LQSIVIPSTVEEIGQYAFSSCKELREVVLNEGLTSIGKYAFTCCSSLQSIVIPSAIVEICSRTFDSCTNLRDVVLNNGIKKIGQSTFAYCTSLQQSTIPSTVIEIEQYAFRGCRRLREVVIHNNEGIQIRGNTFYNCSSLERFSFPSLSTRLDNVIQAGQRDIEAKLDDITAIEWRRRELIIPVIHREIEIELGMVGIAAVVDIEKLKKVKGLISYYELKEATTLFELALWKTKIDQADDEINRDECRTEVPGPVKDAILQCTFRHYNNR